MNAVTKDNRPYCPKCGCGEFEIRGYNLIMKDIIAECRKCGTMYQYKVTFTLEKNIGYV